MTLVNLAELTAALAERDAARAEVARLRAAVTEPPCLAVEAVAWERAPRYPRRSVNRRIVCADGFKASVQASSMHYANDSHPSGEAPYWNGEREIVYPFTTFEVANPTGDLPPVWDEYDSGGVWAWVPRSVVADLIASHGGAVDWEPQP